MYLVQFYVILIEPYIYVQKPWMNAVAVILLILSILLTVYFPRVRLLKPKGKYGVGTMHVHLESKDGSHRGLIVKVWYPCDLKDCKPENRAKYIRDEDFEDVIEQWKPFRRFMLSHLRHLQTNSFTNVRLSAKQKRYPVLVQTHGMYAVPEVYSIYSENAASHGNVVFGIYHTDQSAAIVNYPSGEVIKFKDPPKDFTSEFAKKFCSDKLNIRLQDVKFCVDKICEIAAKPESPSSEKCGLEILNGRLDASRIGIFGHSFGGSTSVAASAVDPRLRSAMSLDGWFEHFDFDKFSFRKPLFFVNSELWQWKENLDKMKTVMDNAEKNGTKVLKYTLKGTRHHNFDDVSALLPLTKTLKAAGPVDVHQAFHITNEFLIRFFEESLGENSDASNYSFLSNIDQLLPASQKY